jgi:hypothetical protein
MTIEQGCSSEKGQGKRQRAEEELGPRQRLIMNRTLDVGIWSAASGLERTQSWSNDNSSKEN